MTTQDFKMFVQKGGFGLLFVFALLVLGCEEKSKNAFDSEKKAPSIFGQLFDKEDDCEDVDVSKSRIEVKIERLEDELMSIKSPEQADAFLTKYPQLAKQFFALEHYPSRGHLTSNLSKLAQDTAIQSLHEQTKVVYANISDLETQFADAFSHIKLYYPDFKAPKVYTIITGLGIETYVSDSIIVLSLDYFLGENAKYKPRDHTGMPFPDYLMKRYHREYIVPSCMLYISNKYNKVDMLENTLLAEMVYYGKAYQFVKTMMPCTNDSLIIGYTGIQLSNSKSHEETIWAFFVDKKLLYETSHFVKTKYTGERPYTADIGPKCPGKIGTWLGWQIIRRYQTNHPDITFQKLMASTSAKSLFLESKYKPEK
jgi:gliding motility-associated lipoprotein GldB